MHQNRYLDMGLPVYEVPGSEVELADRARALMEEASKSETSFLAQARLCGVEKAASQIAQGYVSECLAMVSNRHVLYLTEADRLKRC